MTWNWRAMRAMIGKDLLQVRQNKMIWLPMVILPLLIQVIMPLVMVLLPQVANESEFDDLAPLLAALPAGARQAIEALSMREQWVVFASNYLFAPMFLIVPLMVSSILASDSFAGEKERHTLEALFYTPVSDVELYVAKLLMAWLPAIAISVGSFVTCGIVVNAAGYGIVGRLFFPAPHWWPMVFWLAPAMSLLGLGVTVLISSRAKTAMQAQQMGGVLVLPVVALMAGQSAGLLFLGSGLIWGIGALVWIIGLWLAWVGGKTFSRSAMITRI